MVKAVLFDFFGVICTDIGWAWFAKFVPDPTGEKKQIFQEVLHSYDSGHFTREALYQKMAQLANTEPSSVSDELRAATKIDMPVIDLIKKLRNNYKIGLVSNANGQTIHRILKEHDLSNHFDYIAISSEVGYLKPHREIFELACKNLEVSLNESIFIDDRQEHVTGAANLGIDAILFSGAADLDTQLRSRAVQL